MEYVIDVDIIGEILIPLENNIDKNNKTYRNLDSLLEKNFNDFRSIIFQGEVLRFFLVLKIDSPNNIENLLDEMYFKLEFDPSCDLDEIDSIRADDIENDLGFPNETDNNNVFQDFEKPKYTDLFAIHRNTLFTSADNSKKLDSSGNRINNSEKSSFTYKNLNYEFVSRKYFFKEKKIVVFEILKHIIVPNKFLNRNLILKVNIMKKNNLNFMNKEDYSLMDIYATSIYNDVTEFTILKTLFKEIKIIRPLNIAKIKQLDLNPEVSLIEIKIENITSSINFIDRSLKNSKFLNLGKETDIVTYGIDLTLRDIQILKEETVILNKTILYFKNQEQSRFGLNKENINLENLNFAVINNDMPIELKSGEELVLLIKIIKNIKDFDKIFHQSDSNLLRKTSNTSLNNKDKTLEKRKSSDKTLNLVSKQSSSNLTTSGNKSILTTLANPNSKKNTLERSVTFTESQSNNMNTLSNYNTASSNLLKNSFGNFSTVSNSAKSDIKNTMPDRGESGSFYNLSIGFDRMSHATFSSNIAKKIDDGPTRGNALPTQTNANQDYSTNRVVNTKENNLTDNNLNNEVIVLEENDEIIKINLSTPIILDIISKKFYDSLFMSIPIKWQYDIMKFINVEIEIEEQITLHEYFKVYLKIKNLINSKITLDLEIGDCFDDYNEISLINLNNKALEENMNDEMPNIISETKAKEIGTINPKDEKIIDLRFLPLKNGFNTLPNFKLIDNAADRRYLLVCPSKIFVKDKPNFIN